MAVDPHRNRHGGEILFFFLSNFFSFVYVQVKIVFEEDELYSVLQWWTPPETVGPSYTHATPMALWEKSF